jgi:hypothetical protein
LGRKLAEQFKPTPISTTNFPCSLSPALPAGALAKAGRLSPFPILMSLWCVLRILIEERFLVSNLPGFFEQT